MSSSPLAFIPVFLAAACGQTEQSATNVATSPPPPAPIATPAAVMPSPTPVPAAVGSRYTALRGCRVARENREEGGYLLTRCPGVGGYELDVSESDGRQNLAIATGSATRQLDLPGVIGSGFSALGAQAEWRTRAGAARPHALIARYAVVEDPALPDRPTTYLVVVDLARACPTGRIAPGADQNAAARLIADTPSARPCLTVPAA